MNIVSNKKNDFLKLMAVVAMTIDHVGKGLAAPSLEYIAIGRLCFPIFAYGLVEGFYHTSNLKKYLKRLFVFALISQIPYSLYFHTLELNVIFLFFIALLTINNFEKTKKILIIKDDLKFKICNLKFELLNILLLLSVVYFVPVDYGFKGLLIILAFYFFRQKIVWLLLAQGAIIAGFTYWEAFNNIFLISGILLALYLPRNFLSMNLGKYFFYWFYPAHLMLLYLIKISFDL